MATMLEATLKTDIGDILIRPIQETDSMEDLTMLLNKAYRSLADMGFRYFASHQNAEQTRQRVESAEQCFVGILGKRIVATVSYYTKGHDDAPEWYHRPDVAYFGQFGVEPELQGKGVGGGFIDILERKAERDGLAELALDTAEGATHLVRYYGKRGYRFIQYINWNVTNYRSVIMSKALNVEVE